MSELFHFFLRRGLLFFSNQIDFSFEKLQSSVFLFVGDLHPVSMVTFSWSTSSVKRIKVHSQIGLFKSALYLLGWWMEGRMDHVEDWLCNIWMYPSENVSPATHSRYQPDYDLNRKKDFQKRNSLVWDSIFVKTNTSSLLGDELGDNKYEELYVSLYQAIWRSGNKRESNPITLEKEIPDFNIILQLFVLFVVRQGNKIWCFSWKEMCHSSKNFFFFKRRQVVEALQKPSALQRKVAVTSVMERGRRDGKMPPAPTISTV